VSDLVFILVFLLPIAMLVMLTVGLLSAWSAVHIGGWRLLFSGPIGWFQPPSGLDPAVWRHRRRFWTCFFGTLACNILLQFLLFIRPSAM